MSRITYSVGASLAKSAAAALPPVLATPFPSMPLADFIRELNAVEDPEKVRQLAVELFKDLETLRKDLDNVVDLETTLRNAAFSEVRVRDQMIQKVIDLHSPHPGLADLCAVCVVVRPCPTLKALEES